MKSNFDVGYFENVTLITEIFINFLLLLKTYICQAPLFETHDLDTILEILPAVRFYAKSVHEHLDPHSKNCI